MTADDAILRLRGDEVAWREFEGEAILLDLKMSTYFSTNASATVLWRMLDAGATHESLVAALVNEFEVDEQRARADVTAFLQSCRARGLLAKPTEA